MAGRDKIESLRLSIKSIYKDGTEQKRGARYDLLLNEGSTPEMSNEFIANLFAEVARDTVMHELTEEEN